MAFKIHNELKNIIENHPDIIDLIEAGEIEKLYYLFNVDNPNRLSMPTI